MILVIDTGGTKTLVAIFSEDGVMQKSARMETPKEKGDYLAALEHLIQNNFSLDEVRCIAVALPGLIKNDKIVWLGNLNWQDFDIKTELKNRFKKMVFVENDANLAGLSEARALDDMPEVTLYITVSTGIGTGVAVNGRIDNALNGCEAGHMVLSYNGAELEWEDFASGKTIFETYGKSGAEITDVATWKEVAERTSKGMLAIIPCLQPNTVIFGGSMGEHFEQYGNFLREIIDEKLPKFMARPELREAKRPHEAVIYGCYSYALDRSA